MATFSSLKQAPHREMCMWKCVICAYLAQRTQLICRLREKRNFCLWTVQSLMVLSSEAVTRVCPSPEKLTLRTEAVWALKDVDSAFLYVHISTDTTIKLTSFLFCAGRNKEHVPTNPLMENMLERYIGNQMCDSQTGHPQTYSLVSGWGGHQVTRGRKLDRQDCIFVSIKLISSHLRFHVPDHDAGVHRAGGYERSGHMWDKLVFCSWPQEYTSEKINKKEIGNSYQSVSCCSWCPHLSHCPCGPWNAFLKLDQAGEQETDT